MGKFPLLKGRRGMLRLYSDEIYKKRRGIPYPAIECNTKLHPPPLSRRPLQKWE